MSELTIPTSSNAITLQAVAACAEARIPTMIVGAPGVGKTATIRAMADSMGYKLITLLGSTMDPTDMTGLPKGEVIAHDADDNPLWGTVYLAPWWQVRILQEKKIILFLDEFSNTSSAVRAAMLTMLQNREFPNGAQMPEETIILGAMNPTASAADGWELDKPTTNRITFLTWNSPTDEWYAGMLNAWGTEVSDEETFWRRRIVQFLKDNPRYLHKENDAVDGTPEAHGVNIADESELEVLRYAWASRRSWDNLTKILGNVERKNITLQDILASGTIGKAASIALREWILENEIIDPKSALENPASVDWANEEVSNVNIVLRGVVELIDKSNWRKALELLDEIAKADAHALAASYLNDFIIKIIQGSRANSTAEFEEAKTATKKTISAYKRVNPAAGTAAV